MVSRSSTHITPLIWLAKSLKREVSLLLFVPSIGTGESGNGALLHGMVMITVGLSGKNWEFTRKRSNLISNCFYLSVSPDWVVYV